MNNKNNITNNDYFEKLLNLAADCARWQLRQCAGFRPAYLFQNHSEIGAAWPRSNNAESLQDFVQDVRLVGVARNVTAGVLLDLLECQPGPMKDARNDYPIAEKQEMVLVVWGSRTETITYLVPVCRSDTGQFSHLAQPIRAENLPWLSNIVPLCEPSFAAQVEAELLLKPRDVRIEE